MADEQTKILLAALPLVAKITGGYATLTDSQGVMLTNYDYRGKEVHEFKGQVYDMALQCIKEKRPRIGAAHYDQNCMAWAIPIDNHALVCTDTQRIRNEENLKASIKKALPSIVRVVGGNGSIYDKAGQCLASYDSNGDPVEISTVSDESQLAIASNEPILKMSRHAEGAYVVYIPITSDCCLVLNNVATSKKTMKLITEVKQLQHTRYNIGDIVGHSEPLQRTIMEAMRVAPSNSTVLLEGETGTGKEVFAQAIHNSSHREGLPFIAINCGALPASLIESYLFGYMEGSFTGAKKGGMPGSFEQAGEGTIFLDEISELDFSLQSKILRILQEKEVTRIGSNTQIPVNARVISATNRNLLDLVREKKFREDLYYRLNIITIKVPPLRDREGDIPLLAEHFLRKYCSSIGKVATRFNPGAMETLTRYGWPGNVRELENAIEHAVNFVSYTEKEISTIHLPQHISLNAATLQRNTKERLDGPNRTLEEYVGEFEKEVIRQSLEKARYKTGTVAQRLGISVSTLWRKMQKYGLMAGEGDDSR